MEIYKDEKLTLVLKNGVISASTNTNICIYAIEATCSDIIPKEYVTALEKKGVKPDGYYVVKGYGGRVCACFPIASKAAVEKAMRDYKAEVEAARNNPATIARNKVSILFAKADSKYDYPGEYYPLLHDARQALKNWQEKYPDAAKEEKRRKLLADAEDLKSKAIGALVYDADGSLSSDDQQKRHDSWMAEADGKIAEAKALEVTNG